jgi:hypothetical protein
MNVGVNARKSGSAAVPRRIDFETVLTDANAPVLQSLAAALGAGDGNVRVRHKADRVEVSIDFLDEPGLSAQIERAIKRTGPVAS